MGILGITLFVQKPMHAIMTQLVLFENCTLAAIIDFEATFNKITVNAMDKAMRSFNIKPTLDCWFNLTECW